MLRFIKKNKIVIVIIVLVGISMCILSFIISSRSKEGANDYFFPSGRTQIEYEGIIYPLSSEELKQNIKLNITKVTEGNKGILYKLELEQPPVEDTLEMISMGRRYWGYYYVTKEKIYLRFVEGMDGYTAEKDKKL